MPPPRSACVLSQMWCVNIAMSTHAPCWRRPARRRRDWLIVCQFCNAFCITQRKEAKNARVQTSNTPPRTITLDTKYDGVVSVDVWTGYAALLVRKNGERRVVVGPQTVLLEYDERPMMLELSTGTPKTDERKLKTGFLRILNNSVSDSVVVETQDSFAAQ